MTRDEMIDTILAGIGGLGEPGDYETDLGLTVAEIQAMSDEDVSSLLDSVNACIANINSL